MSISAFFNALSYSLAHLLLAMVFFRKYPIWRYIACFVLLFITPFLWEIGNYISLLNVICYMICFFSLKNWKQVLFKSIETVSIGLWLILFLYSLFIAWLPSYYNSNAFNIYMRASLLICTGIFFATQRPKALRNINEQASLYAFILQCLLLLFYVLILSRIKGQGERETALITLSILLLIGLIFFFLYKIAKQALSRQQKQLENDCCQRLINQIQEDMQVYKGLHLPASLKQQSKQISATLIRLQLEFFLHHAIQKNLKNITLSVDDDFQIENTLIYPLYLILHEFFRTAFTEFRKLDIGQMKIIFKKADIPNNLSIEIHSSVYTVKLSLADFCKKRKYIRSFNALSRKMQIPNSIYREFYQHESGAIFLRQQIIFATPIARKKQYDG